MMDISMYVKIEMNKSYFEWINMENRRFLEEVLDALVKKEIPSRELEKIGQSVYEKEISFSKLAIFLDTFSYTLSLDKKKILKVNENMIAKGYLKERLPKEIKSLKVGINNNPNFISKEDIAIIDELLMWLETLIESVLQEKQAPKIEGRIEHFIEFIEQRIGMFFQDPDIQVDFLRTNKELYECALEAVKFYEQKAYYYFVLIYIEMIALFLKMATLLSGMFLEEELLSIYIDPITLLPNRFQLLQDLPVFHNVFIMILNVKSFSKLNVLYGYDFGDTILKKIATFLRASSALKAYRIYGDEFAVLLHSQAEAEELFSKINSALSVVQNGAKYDLFFYGAYEEFEEKALEACEFALFRSKQDLVDSKTIHSMLDEIKQELTMTQKLKEIMIKDAIIPYFQPIYVTDQGVQKVLKYEVLMRLRYDDTILEPQEFLSVLLEAPFYVEFTKSILLKSFEQFQNSEMTFSVNFTLRDIHDKSVQILLETLIARHPDVAKRMTIEIVENEALEEFNLLNNFMKNLKKYGVTFALDDFGSGYSNFAQFAKLEIDFLKIDGSIVSDVLEDEKMQKLIVSICEFAKTLGLVTVAEYVSSKEIFEYLEDKVDMLQGYYIGKPEPFLL